MTDDVTLYLGDCLDILPTLGRVDCVITDPPYSETTHAGARTTSDNGPMGGSIAINFASIKADLLRTALGLCKPTRWVVTFLDWHHALPLEEVPPTGLEFVRLGVWTKSNPMPQLTADRPSTGWEAIALLHPPGRKRWNGGSGPAVWHTGTSRFGYFGPSNHPTEKPLLLVETLIRQFTDPGDIVLDPFMGSGTTGVACVRTGRRFIGIEISEQYFAIAQRRIAEAQMQPPLFPHDEQTQPAMRQEDWTQCFT